MTGILPRTNEHRPLLAIGFVLIAYFMFSCIDTGAKWLAYAGLPAMQLAFMRYAGHFAISLTVVMKGGMRIDRFHSDKFLLTILRGVLLAASTVFNFIAIRYLPLTLTSTILFLAPIIVCALSWPLLGEKVGAYRIAAILAGFVGILIAVRPFGESLHWAVFLSLGAAVSFSFYTLLTRKLSGIVATDTMQFYSGLVGTVALAPFALANWENPEGMSDWAIFIGLGILGYYGHELLTRAHGFASASSLSPFAYSFMIYLTVWSFFVFDNLPDLWTIVGAVVVASAGLVIWARERSKLHTQIT
ncbi:MAG: DMT family transporter [Stappiaceae bacterium]